jgi:inosine/xanthosine triphosphatase
VLVRAGTTNSAKLEAVRRGLGALLPEVRVEPFAAPSGVSEQPIGLDEIVQGAIHRARAAWAAGPCELACGIEDGLFPVPETATGYMNVGCAALHDGHRDFLGLSAGFEYPRGCVEAALAPRRTPVGDSFARLFTPAPGWPEPDPSGGWGNIGRLTGGALTRVDYGAQAVSCAAVRMLHPELYGESRP